MFPSPSLATGPYHEQISISLLSSDCLDLVNMSSLPYRYHLTVSQYKSPSAQSIERMICLYVNRSQSTGRVPHQGTRNHAQSRVRPKANNPISNRQSPLVRYQVRLIGQPEDQRVRVCPFISIQRLVAPPSALDILSPGCLIEWLRQQAFFPRGRLSHISFV